ncbi:DNA starvation/stationary phase protection protein [Hahella aquimaris]|uniref:Dps family protein n=1 Tax=Hahella sp. HNIBRBA332 TaxID=3015983 RepID=UPI00273B0A27|nr:DNA starvation/stationary phase protection protein [Hahella sp. HNIBRBA332]WLQ17226.1 DNA starvation/stationary phase protection protein [Hahella sp. HNIBRBA332]
MNQHAKKLDLTATSPDMGIKENKADSVADKLARVLADTYSLYLYTQYAHWNVRGMNFFALHELFEKQYKELAETIDDIAERMRAIGYKAPGALSRMAELSTISPKEERTATALIKELITAHEGTVASCRKCITAAQKAEDFATEDLMVNRLASHEQAVWMLGSLLEE